MNLLDSCGWIEIFADGRFAEKYMPALVNRGELVVPTICIYEVVKVISAQMGETRAEEAAATMCEGTVVSPDENLALAAAGLSRRYGIPMVDSIILATARANDAVI